MRLQALVLAIALKTAVVAPDSIDQLCTAISDLGNRSHLIETDNDSASFHHSSSKAALIRQDVLQSLGRDDSRYQRELSVDIEDASWTDQQQQLGTGNLTSGSWSVDRFLVTLQGQLKSKSQASLR